MFHTTPQMVLPLRTVIIPTYNEEENIGKLIESIYRYLDEENLEVIVVDDDSTDNTQEIVRNLTTKYDNVRLIVRTKERGLSTAVRRGAKEAHEGPVVVMDADFSHHPRFLSDMFATLEAGYDVVVGSRYTTGGKVRGWPGSRIAVSKVATLLARTLLRISVKDPVSGFVGCKSPQILARSIEHAEYKFLVETLAKNRNLRATEVPIVFQDRLWGESKLDQTTILLYIQLVFRLFFYQILGRIDSATTPKLSRGGQHSTER
ncbi:MAG: glycosyltransferase [Candidatus Lokiarchaeota archaeon]|nr:glycosyltransferase [Candidatus Lokiarchaeota archaeon]